MFENFKKFKGLVEKESGLMIKAMRSDHEGEFTSNGFKKYCEDHGIRQPLTMLRSPPPPPPKKKRSGGKEE